MVSQGIFVVRLIQSPTADISTDHPAISNLLKAKISQACGLLQLAHALAAECRPALLGADNDRRKEPVNPIDKPEVMKTPKDLASPLDHHAENSIPGQLSQETLDGNARAIKPPDSRPSLFQLLSLRGSQTCSGRHDASARFQHPCAERNSEPRIQHNAPGFNWTGGPEAEMRVVGKNGIHPHQNSLMLPPDLVCSASRFRIRDPLRGSCSSSDLPIKACGHLRCDEGQTCSSEFQINFIQGCCLCAADAGDYLQAMLAKDRCTLAVDNRIGIGNCVDQAADSRLENSVRARRGSTEMAARFQIYIKCCIARARPSLLQRLDFRVWSACAVMKTAPHNLAAADNHTANPRIRIG